MAGTTAPSGSIAPPAMAPSAAAISTAPPARAAVAWPAAPAPAAGRCWTRRTRVQRRPPRLSRRPDTCRSPGCKLVGRNGTEPVQVNGQLIPLWRRTTSVLTTIRKRLNSDEGFTLVELLVVILIIGILAAIAIPSFLNQKGKGEDASAKSAAREVATALETYYTDKGDYAATDSPTLRQIEPTLPADGPGLGTMTLSA